MKLRKQNKGLLWDDRMPMRERETGREACISSARLREFTFVCRVRRNMRALSRGKVSLPKDSERKEVPERKSRLLRE